MAGGTPLGILVSITQVASASADQWHRMWAEPLRSRGLHAAYQQFTAPSSQPFVPPVWNLRTDPVRFRPLTAAHLAQPAWNTSTVPEAVLVSKWYPALSEPVRFKQLFPAHLAEPAWNTSTAKEAVTVDRWLIQFADPVRFAPRPFVAPAFVPVVAAAAGTAGSPAVERARYRPSRFYQVKTEPVLVPAQENITPDKWYQQLSEPVRIRPRIEGGLAWTQSVFNGPGNGQERWYQPLSEPVRIRPRIEGGLSWTQSVFGGASTGQERWFVQLNEPVRFRAMPTAQQRDFTIDPAALTLPSPPPPPAATDPGLPASWLTKKQLEDFRRRRHEQAEKMRALWAENAHEAERLHRDVMAGVRGQAGLAVPTLAAKAVLVPGPDPDEDESEIEWLLLNV